MERLLLVRNGGGAVVRLPPGFRFHPTDEELVVEYLKRKAFSFPVPPSIIPELHLCNSDPWDLPGDTEQERYFFSRREVKYRNGNRSNRATPSGYWKATGIDKKVIKSRHQLVVGMKKTLVFYTGKPPRGSRTDWVMHEYRLLPLHQPCEIEMENYWVICRIFLKKTSSSKKQVSGSPVFYDFLANENRPNSSEASSSSWSGITDVSSPISNQMEGPVEEEEEESSSSSSSSCYHDLSLTTKPAPP